MQAASLHCHERSRWAQQAKRERVAFNVAVFVPAKSKVDEVLFLSPLAKARFSKIEGEPWARLESACHSMGAARE
jgi:hypothetical protein